jgi:UDP-N-acetylmuramoyl-tripeptide--D-alanyl-D-alanine ligase
VSLMTLREAQALLPGARLVGDGATAFERVHSDTRTLRPGDLFVALRGERFDAHDYLSAARAAGAAAALAERGLAPAGLPGLEVDDALAALQTLAAAWRQRYDGPLVAVAGSNGKTTVTQMVGAILRAAFGEAGLATEGNLNNHIGVPLTLLRLRPAGAGRHCAAVVELGMNHPGEIALLARVAAPTVALVNNAQREHQEFMDGVEAVARENGAAIEALTATGTAVFPADDAMAPIWRAQAGARRTLTFALAVAEGEPRSTTPAAAVAAMPADLEAEALWDAAALAWQVRMRTPAGPLACHLHLPGAHNVRNALAAAACALAAGLDLGSIARGLGAFVPVTGRSQACAITWRGRRATLVDDSYNANPDSVLAAIDVLATLPGPRWLVLGDMGEVGAQGPAFHAEVGTRARERGLEQVWCAGALSAHAARAAGGSARHFDTVDGLLQALPQQAPEAGAILVKGSRFMRMERVVLALRAAAATPAPAPASEAACS